EQRGDLMIDLVQALSGAGLVPSSAGHQVESLPRESPEAIVDGLVMTQQAADENAARRDHDDRRQDHLEELGNLSDTHVTWPRRLPRRSTIPGSGAARPFRSIRSWPAPSTLTVASETSRTAASFMERPYHPRRVAESTPWSDRPLRAPAERGQIVYTPCRGKS